MAKVIVYTDEAPKPMAGYSQAVKYGGFVFLSLVKDPLMPGQVRWLEQPSRNRRLNA